MLLLQPRDAQLLQPVCELLQLRLETHREELMGLFTVVLILSLILLARFCSLQKSVQVSLPKVKSRLFTMYFLQQPRYLPPY